MDTPSTLATAPRLTASDDRLGALYASALATVDRAVHSSPRDGGRILCAGGGYPTPWTRDAAINCWSAASLLDPALAERTLREVTEPGERGEVVQQDDQRWDQAVWILGARRHAEITGDEGFRAWAHGVAMRTLALREEAFRPEEGLYTGGALMQDGISGYPFPAEDAAGASSFIGDHPAAETVMCLSTNVVAAAAHDAAAWLGDGSDVSERGVLLRAAIRRTFRDPSTGRWDYLVDLDGRRCAAQELLGLAMLLEHGDLSDAEARSVARGAERSPAGIALVHPHFDRFSDEHPGRHNEMLWPMATGQWATAAARRSIAEAFAESFDDLVRVVDGSDGAFYEVYDARSGDVFGGWQVGRIWPSEPDQTWSATAYLRSVHEGLVGLRVRPDEIGFEPILPEGLDRVRLTGLVWRGDAIDVEVRGSGSRLLAASVDGEEWPSDRGAVTITRTGRPRTVRILLGRP